MKTITKAIIDKFDPTIVIMDVPSGFAAEQICHTSGRTTFEKKERAKFITESFNVANETGLTPRELLKQRDELLEVLESVKSWCDLNFKGLKIPFKGVGSPGFFEQMQNAINNATK